jgi:hypothetical protein
MLRIPRLRAFLGAAFEHQNARQQQSDKTTSNTAQNEKGQSSPH